MTLDPTSLEPSETEQTPPLGPNSPAITWIRLYSALVAFAVFAYAIAYPLTEHWLANRRSRQPNLEFDAMPLFEAIQLRVMEGLAGLWIFILGGTIGSFLNVVAYRLPRGKSVVTSPSACPTCGTRILARDNIPILGWVLLGGKCRTCKTPISPRYPIVEALVASLFFLLFALELTTGGANIPLRELPARTGITWILFEAKWDLALLYFYHCVLLSVLIAWVLIDLDDQRVPWTAKLVVVAALLIPPMIWPFLLPVPVTWSLQTIEGTGINLTWLESGSASVTGGLVGLVLGYFFRNFGDSWQPRSEERDCDGIRPGHFVSSLAYVGLGLGWQPVLAVTVTAIAVTLVAKLLVKAIPIRPPPMTLCLLIGFCLHHALWRWWMEGLARMLT